jgi:phage replication-related protein YjqB (UPF0714/DUF867 family)
MNHSDRYISFAQLACHEREGQDYRRLVERHISHIAIVAPHGGGIEPGTSEVARALAGREFALYCFEGVRPSGNDELHITSHRFDEPTCIQLVGHAQTVVAIHGCAGQREAVYVGGLDRGLQAHLIAALRRAGFDAQAGDGDQAGRYVRNICNRGRSGRGVQLEVSRGLRLAMFKGLKRREREITTPVFDRFVNAVREVLLGAGPPGLRRSGALRCDVVERKRNGREI